VGTEQLRGDVVLFNVWASWCVSCRAEHPVLQALADRHGVPVVGLNYKDKRADALQYLNRLGDPYGWNAHDLDGRVGIDWGVYGTPETFIVDRQGRIRYKHVGPISWQQAEKEILPLIRQIRSEG
jgi:cytochrome c biogenesis protein CcmG, thiol:disulfide interchange protein DsbE